MTAVGPVLVYLIFSGVVGAAILALKLPGVILDGYLVIAALGFVMLIRDLVARRAAREEFQKDVVDRFIESERLRARQAEDARRSPWFADSVVDLDAASQRAAIDGYVMYGVDHLRVPNPCFVLPTEAIVRWGFATGPQVEAAYAIARNGTEPIRWRNPLLLRELRWMGWDEVESVARIGLVLGASDSGSPTAGT